MNQIILVLSILVIPFHILAQENTSTIFTPQPESEPAAKKKFGLQVGLENSSNLYKEGTSEAQRSMDLSLTPSYHLRENLKLSAAEILSSPQSGPDKNTVSVSDLRVILDIQKIAQVAGVSINLQPSVVASTSKESIETDRLYGGVGVGILLSREFGKLSTAYRIGVDRYAHEYTLDEEGQVNNQYVLGHTAILEMPILERLTFNITGRFQTAWSYRNIAREKYSHSESLSYSIQENLSISVGHSNEGSAFKANGRDSNLAMFRESDSSLSIGVTYIY